MTLVGRHHVAGRGDDRPDCGDSQASDRPDYSRHHNRLDQSIEADLIPNQCELTVDAVRHPVHALQTAAIDRNGLPVVDDRRRRFLYSHFQPPVSYGPYGQRDTIRQEPDTVATQKFSRSPHSRWNPYRIANSHAQQPLHKTQSNCVELASCARRLSAASTLQIKIATAFAGWPSNSAITTAPSSLSATIEDLNSIGSTSTPRQHPTRPNRDALSAVAAHPVGDQRCTDQRGDNHHSHPPIHRSPSRENAAAHTSPGLRQLTDRGGKRFCVSLPGFSRARRRASC
jgi:hypothetical protein